MTFSSPAEIQTMRELKAVLAPMGYDVSQKARLLDCARAAARNPAATTPPGPTLGDALIPAMRQLAGPFGEAHPWLRPGDWTYAFKAHLDFVVHDGVYGAHPTHPLFAVEFDGRWTHDSAEAQVRDRRKNRLCAASGLPLVRIGEEFLHKRERLSTIAWLAQLWAHHREEMPELLADRDADFARLPEAEQESPWLLGEHPELDVDLVFSARHPFPAVQHLARWLAARYGFAWPLVDAEPDDAQWTVERFSLPVFDLADGMVQTWSCEATIRGPSDFTKTVAVRAQVRVGYPIHDEDVVVGWGGFLRGTLPWLPAGPWTGASAMLGDALCTHNLLVEIGHVIKAQERRRRGRGVAGPGRSRP
ncbi:DUF2726 domain-containing protein [Amycolatopsis sp. NPDC004772]